MPEKNTPQSDESLAQQADAPVTPTEGQAPDQGAASLSEARMVLANLFKEAKVEAIYCIDDEFAVDHPNVVPTDLFDVLEGADLAQLTGLGGIHSVAPREVLVQKCQELWPTLQKADRSKLHSQLCAIGKTRGVVPVGAEKLALTLEAATGLQVNRLSWSSWREQEGQLVTSRFQGKFTFLLVDQDFSNESADSRGGIQILRTLQETIPAAEAEARLRCALLTNTKNPGEEHAAWHSFATDERLERSRFMLISKERLLEEQFGGFVLMARLTIMNPICETLRAKASDVYGRALSQAANHLQGVTIYDMERIVIASSRKEGVWEPDTLFRILGLYLRREARTIAMADQPLRALADHVRSLAGPSTIDPKQEPSKAIEIRRLELYEDGEYLNKHHTPIDLGDVFEIIKQDGSPGKRFILIGQPCELMVRYENPLNGKRRPAAVDAFLAEVVATKPSADSYTLPYFEPIGAPAYVAFGKAQTVGLALLDLCVFQSDGKASISASEPPPGGLIPSWRARHSVIVKQLTSICDRIARLCQGLATPEAKDRKGKTAVEITYNALVRSSIDAEFAPSALFQPRLDCTQGKQSLSFNFRRLRRFNQPWAGELLTKFSLHLSRAAFEHDFGMMGLQGDAQ